MIPRGTIATITSVNSMPTCIASNGLSNSANPGACVVDMYCKRHSLYSSLYFQVYASLPSP